MERTVSHEHNGGFASIRSVPADRGKHGAQTSFIETRATFGDREVPGAPAPFTARVRQVDLMLVEHQAGAFALEVLRKGLA